MMLFLAFLFALYVSGALIIANGIENAPEGFEDETGFNVVWQNNSPEIADVACVWTVAEAVPA